MLQNFSITDVAKRIFAGYPKSWSPEPTWDDAPNVAIADQVSPNLKATLMALAAGWKSGSVSSTGYFDLLYYVEKQTRITTATGFWLDYIALDFTAGQIQRYVNETDDAFRRRIQIEVLRPKGTRCALECGLTNLTGFKPTIIEPMNPGDTGSYGDLAATVRLTVAHPVHQQPFVYVNDTTGISPGMILGGNGIRNTVVITALNGNRLTTNPSITAAAGDILFAYKAAGPIGYSTAGAYGSINSNTETTVTVAINNSKTITVHSSADMFVGMLLASGNIPFPVTIVAVHGNVITVNNPVTLAVGSIVSAYQPSLAGTPYQLFVTAIRPDGEGIPNVSGYSMSHSGYSTTGNNAYGYYGGKLFPPDYGYGQYCSLDEIQGNVTDVSIYQNISDSMPAGTTAWTKIISQRPISGLYSTGMLGINFYLNYTALAFPPELMPDSLSVSFSVPFTMTGSLNVSRLSGLAGIFQPTLKTTFLQIGNIASAIKVPFMLKTNIAVQGGVAITIPALFKMNATLTQGIGTVTYLGATSVPPFIIGKSLLVPAGGKTSHTFILGSGNSKLGAGIYGY